MQNGYQQISNYLARGLDIRLGATVTEIAHDEDGITVTTADGSNFTCEIPPAFPPTSVLSPLQLSCGTGQYQKRVLGCIMSVH